MPVKFKVVPIKLTVPPAYTCTYVASDVLDNAAVADLVNLSNPTIPAATARTVLEALRDIAVEQLADGYTVKLDRFISLVPSIPVRLALPTDPVVGSDVVPNAKILKPFKDDVQVISTVSRLGYFTKVPSIISTYETNTEEQQYARDGYGLAMEGNNLGFDVSQADEGIFMYSPAGNWIKQTNITLNDPSRLTCVFIEDATDAINEVEYTLEVRTRYTPGGELRIGSFGKPVRKLNVVTGISPNVLTTNTNNTTCDIVSYIGTGGLAKFIARQDPISDKYFVSVGWLGGTQGAEVEVTAGGGQTLYGLDVGISFNINSWAEFTANVAAYDRYMFDYCILDASI